MKHSTLKMIVMPSKVHVSGIMFFPASEVSCLVLGGGDSDVLRAGEIRSCACVEDLEDPGSVGVADLELE